MATSPFPKALLNEAVKTILTIDKTGDPVNEERTLFVYGFEEFMVFLDKDAQGKRQLNSVSLLFGGFTFLISKDLTVSFEGEGAVYEVTNDALVGAVAKAVEARIILAKEQLKN